MKVGWYGLVTGAANKTVDAVCWYGTPVETLPDLGSGVAEWGQLLVRALTFRIATFHLVGAWDEGLAARHTSVVDAVVALAR